MENCAVTEKNNKIISCTYKNYDVDRGIRITKAMDACGYEYNCQVSYEIGVTESTVSRWRMGKPISLRHVISLCIFLDVSLDHILLGQDKDNHDKAARNSPVEFHRIYSMLDSENKMLVLNLMKRLSASGPRKPSPSVSTTAIRSRPHSRHPIHPSTDDYPPAALRA